jgi:DeoR/GlpR family transcriptional regulator of sugar metabolism
MKSNANSAVTNTKKAEIILRRRKIFSALDQGPMDIPQLAEALGVSPMTIRRDLDALQKQGRILRIFGGGVARKPINNSSFTNKASQNKSAKDRIGQIAAGLIEPRESVFIDSGSTCQAVALSLRGFKSCSIITTNLCVASEFLGQSEIRVLIPPGRISSQGPDIHGEWTLNYLSGLQFDVAFLGCDAISPAEGFYASDGTIADISRIVLAKSRRKYLVADTSKFTRAASCLVAPLTDLTGIIAEKQPLPQIRKALDALGLRLFHSLPAQKPTMKKNEILEELVHV